MSEATSGRSGEEREIRGSSTGLYLEQTPFNILGLMGKQHDTLANSFPIQTVGGLSGNTFQNDDMILDDVFEALLVKCSVWNLLGLIPRLSVLKLLVC